MDEQKPYNDALDMAIGIYTVIANNTKDHVEVELHPLDYVVNKVNDPKFTPFCMLCELNHTYNQFISGARDSSVIFELTESYIKHKSLLDHDPKLIRDMKARISRSGEYTFQDLVKYLDKLEVIVNDRS